MAQTINKILGNPLLIIFATILTILLILSLQESSKKANLSKENIKKNQENVAELRVKMQKKELSLENVASNLYKEKISRNELLKQKEGEIVMQVPIGGLKLNKLDKEVSSKQEL